LLEDICRQGCARRILVPHSETDSALGGFSETTPSDLVALDAPHPQPRNRLQHAYDLLRRAVG
jgi:hypothetical protein